MIENSLDKLIGEFRTKAKVFQEVVRLKYPRLAPFETWRSRARQAWLYDNKSKGPVAKPGTSYHEKGMAVDRIFLNTKGKPTRSGDYKYLHYVGVMCGMVPVKGENCHLQDDKKPIVVIMNNNSKRYNKSTSTSEQRLLSLVNNAFRRYGYK